MESQKVESTRERRELRSAEKRRKFGDGKKKDDLGRGKGGAALLSPPLGSLLPSRFTLFFASPPPSPLTTEPSPRLKLGKQ